MQTKGTNMLPYPQTTLAYIFVTCEECGRRVVIHAREAGLTECVCGVGNWPDEAVDLDDTQVRKLRGRENG